jgi:hypothetical protein
MHSKDGSRNLELDKAKSTEEVNITEKGGQLWMRVTWAPHRKEGRDADMSAKEKGNTPRHHQERKRSNTTLPRW